MSQKTSREFKFVDGRTWKKRKRAPPEQFRGAPAFSSSRRDPTASTLPVSQKAVVFNANTTRDNDEDQYRKQFELLCAIPTPNSSCSNGSLAQMAEVAESPLIDPQLSVTEALDELASWPPEAELNAFDEPALCTGEILNNSSHQAHEDSPQNRDSTGLLWSEHRIHLPDLEPTNTEHGERREENQTEGDSECPDENLGRNEASDVLPSLLGDHGIPDSLALMLSQCNESCHCTICTRKLICFKHR